MTNTPPPGCVHADSLIRLQVNLHDIDQPALPGLPDPGHRVNVLRDQVLIPYPDTPLDAGGWWDMDPANTSTTRMSLDVRGDDNADTVEHRAMTILAADDRLEWFDMDRLEYEYSNVPDMNDRDAAVYAAVNELIPDDFRKWVGLINVVYTPEVV